MFIYSTLWMYDLAVTQFSRAFCANPIGNGRGALPVILVTGYGDLDATKESGESRVLLKPYSESNLADKITSALTLIETHTLKQTLPVCSRSASTPAPMEKALPRREQNFVRQQTDDNDDEHDANNLIHGI